MAAKKRPAASKKAAAKKQAMQKRQAAVKRAEAAKKAAAAAAKRAAQVADKKPPAPTAPTAANPFLAGDDLLQLGQFTQDYETRLAQMDFDLENLEIDTTQQRGQVDKQAQAASSATTDDAIARGIFRSSIRDAALYDIEATRALQQKFLDDKLTAAKLDAGAQKGIIARGKEAFDKGQRQRMLENARPINDAANATYAEAKARFDTASSAWQKQSAAAQKRAAAAQQRARQMKASLDRVRQQTKVALGRNKKAGI